MGFPFRFQRFLALCPGQKRVRRGLLVLAVVVHMGLMGKAEAQQLDGQYVALRTPPAPHSLDVVVVEEFLNFSCPHCNKFRDAAKPVFDKYGKRLKLVRVPVLFRGQDDSPLRLFYVAQAKGLEDQMDEALFDASFKSGVNVFDPRVVNYLARTGGIKAEYDKDGASGWVTNRIADGQARADAYGVEATPTLILQGTLRLVPDSTMEAFVDNFDKVVGQLLKRRRPGTNGGAAASPSGAPAHEGAGPAPQSAAVAPAN